jgi:hypothetical protein
LPQYVRRARIRLRDDLVPYTYLVISSSLW